MSDKKMIPILQVGNVLISPDIITEKFCCNLDACKGICCVEGDAGAPVSMEEIAAIEDVVDTVWGDLSASAQSVIDKQGIAYTDRDGDLVTSIVHGKDCVFTFYDNLIGLNYHRWDICKDAVRKGKELNLPIYKFLKGPLIRRFGKEWYTELEAVAKHLLSE